MISLNYIPRCLCLTLVFVLIAVSANPGGEETSQFAKEGLPFMKKILLQLSHWRSTCRRNLP